MSETSTSCINEHQYLQCLTLVTCISSQTLLHQTYSLGVKEVDGEKGKDVEIEFQSILPTEILASLNQIQGETEDSQEETRKSCPSFGQCLNTKVSDINISYIVHYIHTYYLSAITWHTHKQQHHEQMSNRTVHCRCQIIYTLTHNYNQTICT